MRLLYVEDDRINTLLFEETCRLSGSLEVRSVECGADALALAKSFRPDVLVIDLHLPDIDGYQLLGHLRGVEGMAGTPAFLCSAEVLEIVAEPAARAGFTGCWPKPVQLGDILADLDRLRGQA
jgi:two-component system, OmpR family, response regulator